MTVKNGKSVFYNAGENNRNSNLKIEKQQIKNRISDLNRKKKIMSEVCLCVDHKQSQFSDLNDLISLACTSIFICHMDRLDKMIWGPC
jgi:hypothetical protein